jgi:hypothetical protein
MLTIPPALIERGVTIQLEKPASDRYTALVRIAGVNQQSYQFMFRTYANLFLLQNAVNSWLITVEENFAKLPPLPEKLTTEEIAKALSYAPVPAPTLSKAERTAALLSKLSSHSLK